MKQFFEKEQLCKLHFQTQANHQEDTKLHHFVSTETLISSLRAIESSHRKSRFSNNFFSSFRAFQPEELYHSQTFSLSFPVIERRVKIEDRKLLKSRLPQEEIFTSLLINKRRRSNLKKNLLQWGCECHQEK
jgi:hypothetical protein